MRLLSFKSSHLSQATEGLLCSVRGVTSEPKGNAKRVVLAAACDAADSCNTVTDKQGLNKAIALSFLKLQQA